MYEDSREVKKTCIKNAIKFRDHLHPNLMIHNVESLKLTIVFNYTIYIVTKL